MGQKGQYISKMTKKANSSAILDDDNNNDNDDDDEELLQPTIRSLLSCFAGWEAG